MDNSKKEFKKLFLHFKVFIIISVCLYAVTVFVFISHLKDLTRKNEEVSKRLLKEIEILHLNVKDLNSWITLQKKLNEKQQPDDYYFEFDEDGDPQVRYKIPPRN